LKNKSQILKYSIGKASVEDIFSFSVSSTIINTNPVVCTSIDLTKLNLTSFFGIIIPFSDTKPHGYIVFNTPLNEFDITLSDTDTEAFEMVSTEHESNLTFKYFLPL